MGSTSETRPRRTVRRPRAEIREIIEDLEDSGLNGSARKERFHKALEQARMYRVTQAARTIRTLLLKWEFKGDFDFWYTDELVATLVDIQGDGAIRFLEQTASDTTVNPLARRSAVIGLGRIGSERSVAAFERLRDAARSLPEAPQAQNPIRIKNASAKLWRWYASGFQELTPSRESLFSR